MSLVSPWQSGKIALDSNAGSWQDLLSGNASVYILGLSGYSHNAAAALIKDGELRYLIEEERLDRKKNSASFPFLSIRECLRLEEISIEQVEHFAFFNRPDLEILGGLRHGVRFLPKSLKLLAGKHGGEGGVGGVSFLERVRRFYSVPETLQDAFALSEAPHVHFVEHHLAHAASAFYPSGFGKAAILTWDGRGDIACTVGWLGEGQHIRKQAQVNIPHSIGYYYNAITGYLGFRTFEDEWKVMGLSAYGSDALVERFRDTYHLLENGQYRLNLSYFSHHHYGLRRLLSDRFLEVFGPPRKTGEPLTSRHFDIARAAQVSIQEMGLHFASHLRKSSGCETLCMTGGVSQNILLNSHIAEKAGFREIFVQPVATDAGTAWGSALALAHGKLGLERAPPMTDVYFGPSYSETQIEEILCRIGLPYSRPADICKTAAEALHAGKIVGWFQGRMEAGPRALGNRSLLSSPCRDEYKDRLNERIKRRESFRPFAPAVMEERANDFFSNLWPQPSRYMAASALVHPAVRSLIPAVTHVDGSARPQLVCRSTNPVFWRLLEEFEKLSGVPVLLNTSFNEREPIVCTPDDAIRTFQRTETDCVVLGPFFVERTPT